MYEVIGLTKLSKSKLIFFLNMRSIVRYIHVHEFNSFFSIKLVKENR